MRGALLALLLSFCSLVMAQSFPTLELTQSSLNVKWKTISNDYVQLIYPSYMQEESTYFANLIEHYSQFVGKTYGIDKPQKFPLIIRSEMADPNGFVTLAPRRSEWYTNAGFSSFVGSSEWYQTLSIHEYRHLNQYDHFNQNTVHTARYFFGDVAQQMATFLSLQSWYFEGDAVWAETKYTDAGRGRSPIFLSRLKALLLSEKTPTYDEFVNGTYNNSLVNQYVYGYALISYATKKFGEDFWKKVIDDVTVFPHPRRLYSSFKKVSGQDFIEFYDETMNSFKSAWIQDADKTYVKSDYRENTYPFEINGELYHLNYTLDTHWAFYKNKEKIIDLSFIKDLSQFSAAQGYGVYTQFIPDVRFGYKGTSEIVLVNVKDKSQMRITNGGRFYNPRLDFEGKRIFAAEFTKNNKWVMSELDLKGKKIRSVEFKDHLVIEANPIGNDEAVVLMSDFTGHKSISKVNFKGEILKVLLPPSRNNISSINTDSGHNVFFEAQYKGYVNIFKLKSNDGSLHQCTNASIAANTPFSNNQKVFYSNVDSNGSKIAEVQIADCRSLPLDSLVKFNYLSDAVSDNYNKFPLQSFDDQNELRTKNASKYKAEDFSDFSTELFIPHTWGFVGGNGFELSAKTDNYLRTYSIDGTYGLESGEDASYGELNFNIKKYYPVFKLTTAITERSIEYYGSDSDRKWTEKMAGVSVIVPYTKRSFLTTYGAEIGAAVNYLNTSDYKIDSTELNYAARNFKLLSTYLAFGFSEDHTYRSILPPWSLNYKSTYDNADNSDNANYSGYRFSQKLEATMPGFLNNNGFKFILSQEKQKIDNNSYVFKTSLANPIDYAFSRGYNYYSVKQFDKASVNYIFPLASPDLNLAGWYYLKRVTSNLYFDSTHIKTNTLGKTYNSYGAELEFESKILRILPINLGTRYIFKMAEKSNVGEIYVKLDL